MQQSLFISKMSSVKVKIFDGSSYERCKVVNFDPKSPPRFKLRTCVCVCVCV